MNMKYTFEMQKGEFWWGGSTYEGINMPFSAESTYEADYRIKALNQTMPLFLSNRGRYIWSEKPFAVKIENGVFEMEGEEITLCEAGKTLRDAYLAAMQAHFPFSGKSLPRLFFETAQYNTWMEFTYTPTEEGVIRYAEDILKNGFAPGILIIDEGWQREYGDWRFDPEKFPHPKQMVEKLHAMGFTVMVWVTPFVRPDGERFVRNAYYDNADKNYFARTDDGEVAFVRWWNGVSAVLDFTKESDRDYLDTQLQSLMRDVGVDGFKFDGGTVFCYSKGLAVGPMISSEKEAYEYNLAWNRFGERYTFHEYKDTFKGGGKAVIQRICDKRHRWTDQGLDCLIPSGICMGLIGHPFVCPDMVGGGEWTDADGENGKIDEELFVRMAQCSALFPMMQFSLAPWRVLSEENLSYVRAAAELHRKMAPVICACISESEQTGEPALRSLAYQYPEGGYEEIRDQFILGDSLMIAPVITPKTTERRVVFPEGKWKAPDGSIYEGNRTEILSAPLDTLLYFEKI